MSTDIPIVQIKHQAHTTVPITSDTTLVDDPVALVDDPVALSGGPTTPIGNLSQAIDAKPPRAIIRRWR